MKYSKICIFNVYILEFYVDRARVSGANDLFPNIKFLQSDGENEENDPENNRNPEDGVDATGKEFPRIRNTTLHGPSIPWDREQISGEDKDGYLLDSAWTTNDMPGKYSERYRK